MAGTERTTFKLRTGGLSSCSVGGELVLLDLDGSQYFTVRGSGMHLFDLLAVERERRELVDAVLARFEVDEPTALADVERFLAELSSAGLLSTSS